MHRNRDLARIRLDKGRQGDHGGKAKAREDGDDEEKSEQGGHVSLLKR